MEKHYSFFIALKMKSLQKNQPRSGQCWRQCGNLLADHFHIFWDCPIIQTYWLEIEENINRILDFKLKHDFSTIYLGNIPSTVNTDDMYLIKIMLAASKKALTRRWFLKQPPTKEEWISIVNEICHMERLTFYLNSNMDTFMKQWKKWNSYC